MKVSSNHKKIQSLFNGFSKLSYRERIQILIQSDFISAKDYLKLKAPLNKKIASQFIENYIGIYSLPLGVAVNYMIDKKDYIIPMAVEETSIIASASKTAKWIRDSGSITTKTLGWLGIGQIQIPAVHNPKRFKAMITKNKNQLLDKVNKDLGARMVLRGGGAMNLVIRTIQVDSRRTMAVIHLLVNTCDAMGANIINQMVEFLKPEIEALTQEKVGLCIVSNLVDTKLTHSEIIIKGIDPELGKAIEEASLFAELDPYRAATSNKGMMNAVDGLLIATGNDWRAVEAAVHAYAASSGHYKALTRWRMDDGNLYGECDMPIDVGIVGGVTSLHPIAQLCLKILHINTAAELARIAAAVGLVQNLAALRALSTEGIILGHMKLHTNNLLMRYNVPQDDYNALHKLLTEHLLMTHHLSGIDVERIITLFKKEKMKTNQSLFKP